MPHQIDLVIQGNNTISIDGHTLADGNGLVEALHSALERDPNLVLVVAPARNAHYEVIGKVLYTIHRIGFSSENLRFKKEDGAVVRFDALKRET